MVNGEVVLPLSPDMDMDMPSAPSSETFGQMQLPQRRACAVLARTTRRSLAFLGGPTIPPTDYWGGPILLA